MNAILLGWLGSTEIIVIVLVVLLLFGGRKIPELMRGIGKGIKEFRSGMNEKDDPRAGEKNP
ncbi:MAG TPA: twin-arginine translocase TatA/TatE family subunit [Bacteroidales bacterium]|nr:twin-arginine translocase TatA/TatE family subunit [Bacteroidales bacterium]